MDKRTILAIIKSFFTQNKDHDFTFAHNPMLDRVGKIFTGGWGAVTHPCPPLATPLGSPANFRAPEGLRRTLPHNLSSPKGLLGKPPVTLVPATAEHRDKPPHAPYTAFHTFPCVSHYSPTIFSRSYSSLPFSPSPDDHL